MSVRLILVCKEGPSRNAYLKEAMSLGIEVDVVASFSELLNAMNKTPYQGIMLDVVTGLKASREGKDMAQNILGAFPLVQLKWDPQTNRIYTISSDASVNSTLAYFIAYECQPFTPRTIRLEARKYINLNVEIYKDDHLNPSDMECSVTINVSKGGCFLCSFANWSGISNIRMVVKELEDQTPLAGEILWWQPWGKSMGIPGLGIRVTRISTHQKKQLTEEFHI